MSGRTLRALQSILDAVNWRDAPLEALHLTSAANVLPTRLPIGPLAAAALGASGLAAATLWQQRGGGPQQVGIDMRAATLGMTTATYLRVDDKPVKSWDPITGYYPVRDGGWVYLHGNFPHLRDGLLNLFAVPNDANALRKALTGWSATEVEDAVGARGLCGVVVRDRAAWTAHPQAQATTTLPLIEITRIGDAPPRALAPGQRPLSGMRVLDLSRVIAGPMATRTLAEHGATVMLVSAPHLPSIESLVIDTGFGKHSAMVDLTTDAGHATLRGLAGSTDVFLNAYRPGTLEQRGFSAAAMAQLRPGMVYVTISAFSRAGPWAQRRGYDTLVAAASGLTWNKDHQPPARLPCQPLDYLTGYLGALGAMVALQRQAREGGSWHVQLSLERTAAWIWEMTDQLGFEAAPATAVPTEAEISDLYAKSASVFGQLRFLKPVAQLSLTPAGWDRSPVRLGADPARWPATHCK
jgi:crotonobetainyl-CoA:carnitine CoA-transferase CaiB-like acyl-CoA transferase